MELNELSEDALLHYFYSLAYPMTMEYELVCLTLKDCMISHLALNSQLFRELNQLIDFSRRMLKAS